MPRPALSLLEQKIGYQFQDIAKLKRALTHRSAAALHNERLEFLGDAILGQIMALYLFQRFPKAREGELSRIRSSLVQGKTLAKMAKEFDIGPFLILGSGELKSGGHRRESILADTVEAIIGAIFVDCNDLERVKELVLDWYATRLESLSQKESGKDPKTLLQEWLQGRKMELPDYQLVKTEGEAHNQTFYIRCSIQELQLSVDAVEKSRKKAEQLAAKKALEKIKT